MRHWLLIKLILFKSIATTGHLDAFYKNISGDALQEGERAMLMNGCFDLLWSAHWHRLQLGFSGAVELNALNVELSPDGME